MVNSLEVLWKSFEPIHSQYVFGIKESKRLEEVKSRFALLKQEMANTVTECQNQIEIDQAAERLLCDDQSSIKSDGSQHSQQSVSSTTSSSRKEKLRAVLIARKKLELAKTRAEDEAESARLLHEQNTKRELRRLQDETALAELDWKIETEYKEEDSLPAVDDPPIYLKPRVGKQQHSMLQCPLVRDSEPKETGPLPTPKSRSIFSSVTVPTRIPPKNGRAYDAEHHATNKANDSRTGIMGHQSPSPKHPQTNVRSVRSEKDGNGAHTPKDHVAAM